MRAVALLSLALLSCTDPRLVSSQASLRVEPPEVSFEKTAVGGSRSAKVRALNTGRAALDVEAPADAPFAIEPARFRLGGGESRELTVRFAPTAPGLYEQSALTMLRGEGVDAPDCGAPERCHLRSFDVETGACVDAPAPDGEVCGEGSRCISSGHCLAGQCLGVLAYCDDGDACTTDACSEQSGCLHLDASAQCEGAGDDPCLAPACDPLKGCVSAPVLDGTACGENDCTTAHVCISGACAKVSAPEGSVCAEATPCRDEGRCRSAKCELPATHPMRERWRYQTAGTQLTYEGWVDPAGNVYALEGVWGQEQRELFSLTASGIERFRVVVPAFVQRLSLDPSRNRLVLLMDNQTIEVRSMGTGALIKSIDGVAELRKVLGQTAPVELAVSVYGFHLQPSGALIAYGRSRNEPPQPDVWLASFSLATGAVSWVRRDPAPFAYSEVVGDEAGNLYYLNGPWQDRTAVSLLPNGQPRWSTRVGDAWNDIAVSGDRVAMSGSGALLRASDGALVGTLPSPSDYALLTPRGEWWSLDHWSPKASLTHGNSALNWTFGALDSYFPSGAVVADDGSVLFSNGALNTSDYRLVAISRDGRERFRCALPAQEAGDALEPSGASLSKGLWVQLMRPRSYQVYSDRLIAYEVGKLDVAKSGWVVPSSGLSGGGSPSRSAAPR